MTFYGSRWSLDKKDGYGSKWGSSVNKDGDNSWGSFLGAKVQNSPGREAFPGGWGPSGVGSGWSLDKKDGYGSKWGSLANKDGDNSWGSFPSAKVQNSPGREALPTNVEPFYTQMYTISQTKILQMTSLAVLGS
ncbi:hypothetical protein Ancab_028701 [Ancistrocladus abbreviatus]